MATKKKKVYEEGVRNWKITNQKWIAKRLNFIIECPFCFFKTMIDVKAAAATGKKCKKCKGVHYMTGHTSRGYVPQSSGVKQEIDMSQSRAKLNLPAYKDGTPLDAILRDGWSRGFDPVQTRNEAEVMGFKVELSEVIERWAELDEELAEEQAEEK